MSVWREVSSFWSRSPAARASTCSAPKFSAWKNGNPFGPSSPPVTRRSRCPNDPPSPSQLRRVIRRSAKRRRRRMSGEKELLEACAISSEAALARLGSSDKGLSEVQVLEKRATFGLNEVARKKKLGFIGELLQRCKNPLVIQLFVIA